jgi:hypothetical protein
LRCPWRSADFTKRLVLGKHHIVLEPVAERRRTSCPMQADFPRSLIHGGHWPNAPVRLLAVANACAPVPHRRS